jgi:perosamine synthetase
MTVRSPATLHVASPDLTGRELEYVSEAITSSWISSTGPFVDRFEREFADWCETGWALSAANGTVAIHLALVALGAGPGDEVIVPSLTYIATANAVRYTGATPVFVDVDPATWCLDPAAVESAVTSATRGVIAVDLYGHPADMDALRAVTDSRGLWIVEDAAEAHGARYRGRAAGGLGTIGTFSFYGNKIMSSGEGGALTGNDDDLRRLVRLYRGQGVDPNRRYFFNVVGYNYRLTNVACALLCAQLERADQLIGGRRRVFDLYDRALAGIPGIGFQPVAEWAEPAPWLYCVTVDEAQFGRSRDELAEILTGAGVETRPFFYPIHRLPPYLPETGAPATLPVTDALAASGMNLPTSVRMTPEDVDRVAAAIREARPS